MTSTSSSLLARARLLDAAAWKSLVTLYSPIVIGWCRRSNLGHDDAADVLQEVFSSVWRNIGHYDSERGSFRGWLKTITIRRIQDAARRQQRNAAAPGGSVNHQHVQNIVDLWVTESDQELETDEQQLVKRTAELVRTEFEETTWQAFWMTAVEARAAIDVADDLGISRAAVYKAKSRVLKRLREVLEGLF